MIGTMTTDDIINRLREDYTLTNRGTGWYLAPPYIAYKNQPSEFVPDSIVSAMEKQGLIETSVPFLSCIAKLK